MLENRVAMNSSFKLGEASRGNDIADIVPHLDPILRGGLAFLCGPWVPVTIEFVSETHVNSAIVGGVQELIGTGNEHSQERSPVSEVAVVFSLPDSSLDVAWSPLIETRINIRLKEGGYRERESLYRLHEPGLPSDHGRETGLPDAF